MIPFVFLGTSSIKDHRVHTTMIEFQRERERELSIKREHDIFLYFWDHPHSYGVKRDYIITYNMEPKGITYWRPQ